MTEETLADVDHTHPHTDETFGGVYRRGPAVADGAGPGVGIDGAERLAAVDHEGPGPGATGTDLWKRGRGDGPGSGSGSGDAPDASGDGGDGEADR